MRVITGKAKGHKLIAPKGLHTRPTSDKVKGSVFNILGNINIESKVLDLFAGSGNIGIEFLSRGASTCCFIDNDANSINAIKENLEKTRFSRQATVYKNSVENAITALSLRGLVFDFVFLDPPYEKEFIIPTVEKIYNSKILNERGVIIVEHETKCVLPEYIKGLVKKDFRIYSGTAVSFYINGEVEQ